MAEISIFLGGQAGEGIKRGALTIGKVFNRYGHHIFIMDDFRERVYKLEDTDYKPDNYENAVMKSLEYDDKILTGIFYD